MPYFITSITVFNWKLPCSTSVLREVTLQAETYHAGILLGDVLTKHHHVSLIIAAVVDPEILDPHVPLVKYITMEEVGGGQVLLEIKRNHVHPVFAARQVLTAEVHFLASPAFFNSYPTSACA